MKLLSKLKTLVPVAGLATLAALLPSFGQGATNISTIQISQGNMAIQICGTGCTQVLQQFNIAIVSVNQGGLDYVGSAYLSPAAYDFGDVVQAKAHDFTLRNTSSAQPLIVPPAAIGFSGADPGDFDETNNCPIVMLPGAECGIHVVFAPTQTGPRSAVLAVRDSAIDSPQRVDLAGTGVAATMTPAALDFGSVAIGAQSAPMLAIVNNPGTDPLTLASVSVAGADAGDFAAAGCGSVAPRSTCDIRTSFSPADAGTRLATLVVTTHGLGGTLSTQLTGVGVPLRVSPSGLDFGKVLVGSASDARDITLQNVGAAPLSVTGLKLDGTGAAAYAFSACSSLPAAIPSGGSCAVHVHFSPAAAGPATATLDIAYSSNGSQLAASASLSGTGIAPGFAASPASVAFGSVNVSDHATQAVHVSNPGTAPLTVTRIALAGADPGDYAETTACGQLPVTIAPGSRCELDLTFSPRAAGDRPAALEVEDSAAGSPHVIGLDGSGAVQAHQAQGGDPPHGTGGANSAVSASVSSAASTPGLPNTGAVLPAAAAAGPCLVAFISPNVGRVELAWLAALALLLLAGLLAGWRRRRRA